MAKGNEPDGRHSRWNWSPQDIVIIKMGDENPVKTPDQIEDETPAAEKASGGIPAQGEESKER